jgi:Protein of unknown function (DUF1592)/Protein of unknown function (DUF1588)/Protein of unknown function (DUF1587)/Protein of unknown function (DUF1595)/Protein of unknown function (DUF1585)
MLSCQRPILAVALALALIEPAIGQDFFSKNVYPILQKAGCRSCHAEDGVASATRLHFPPDSASNQEIEAFGTSLASLVDHENPELSLLIRKPTNRVAHTGGERIAPGSEDENLLLRWLRQLPKLVPETLASKLSGRSAHKEIGTMRRLTHSQYNNTVRDLLGDQTRPASQFPQEDFVHGFKNQSEVQSIPPLLAEAYSAVAERLARNAFRRGDTHNLIPCRPASWRDAACRDKFIRQFGRRAFRRPLTQDEQSRYVQLFAREAKHSGKFLTGAQMVVEAMLQSPNFLFRMEEDSRPEWTSYIVASRLSYFLWDTMPDERLFQLAAAGALGSPDEVEQAARLMLKDPRAQQALDEFVSQWLRFDRALNTVKDRRLFPQFNPGLAAAMTEETRRLVAHLVWDRKDFRELFTAEYSFLNSDLASLYHLPAPNEEFERVQFPAGDRAGILGHASFLTLTSKPEETSPTERGLFIREHFLCQRVPPPPPGVNSNLPPLSEDKPRTNRQRLEIHLSSESCSGCHRLVDPIGFGFEKFDAIGQRRETLALTFFPARGDEEKRKPTKVELELDTNANIQGISDSEFSSPKELGAILAKNRECQMCVVRQLFRFAQGRTEMPEDRPVLEGAFQTFEDSQFQFQELMIILAKSMALSSDARSASAEGSGFLFRKGERKVAKSDTKRHPPVVGHAGLSRHQAIFQEVIPWQ